MSELPGARPRIVLLVGLPGSGKSTYLAAKGVETLSSDAIRGLVLGDETNQSDNPRVFATLRFLLRQRLAAGRPVTYVDATHLTVEERRPYFALAEAFGGDVEAVFFDVREAECRARNRRRGRVVPEDAMTKMAARLVPPGPEEGFARIEVVGPAVT